MKCITWLAAAVLATSGCTAVNQTRLPTQSGPGQVFITQESIEEPYDSLGVVQLTRRSVILFGWADVAGTDLESAIEQIRPQIRRADADGLMNMRVEQTQYNTASRIFGAIFFFVPLPSEVTITGELVRLRGKAAAPSAPAPADEAPQAAAATGGAP